MEDSPVGFFWSLWVSNGVQAKSTCCGLWPENFASSIYKVSKGVYVCCFLSPPLSDLSGIQTKQKCSGVAKTVGKASSSSPLHWPDDNSFPWQNHANQSDNSSQDSGYLRHISTGMEHWLALTFLLHPFLALKISQYKVAPKDVHLPCGPLTPETSSASKIACYLWLPKASEGSSKSVSVHVSPEPIRAPPVLQSLCGHSHSPSVWRPGSCRSSSTIWQAEKALEARSYAFRRTAATPSYTRSSSKFATRCGHRFGP